MITNLFVHISCTMTGIREAVVIVAYGFVSVADPEESVTELLPG